MPTNMSEYWKSQPRRFCEVCKCWFGDNRASIDFHERGKRHKENVERHLREARQRTADKEKKDAETAKMLASIEQAATAAYQKDLVQKHGNLPTSQHPKLSSTAPRLPSLPQDSTAAAKLAIFQTIQRHQMKRNQKAEVEIRESSPTSPDLVPPPPPSVWQQATTPEGHVYYYNVFTRVTRWELPADLQSEAGHESEERTDRQAPQQPSSEAGQKRLAEEAGVEQAETHQPAKRRPPNPYGEWTTVSVRQQQPDSSEEEEEEEEEGGGNGEDSDTSSSSSGDDGSGGGDGEKTRFKERTVTSLPAEEEKAVVPGSFKGFSFKKKPGRPQIRQRTSEL